MAGQMGRTGRIGTLLYSLALRDEVQRCLEIGTWNGQGSTLCLAEGLHETDGKLTSIEADEARYAEAVAFYRGKHLPVELLHGVTVGPADYPPFESFLPLIDQADYEREAPGTHLEWYAREIELASTAPRQDLLRGMLADGARFDLVLFDGGEYASSAEFELLEPAIDGWVVLDDTNPRMSIKNAENRRRVFASPLWEVVVDAQDDRCGWTAAKRRRV